MYLERKEDLSLYYFTKDLFSDASYIRIEDGYPESEIVIPTVAVNNGAIDGDKLELGNRKLYAERVWYFDIYAKTKSQRDEFAYRIFHALEESVPVYDYDGGFPPDVVTQLGCLVPDKVRVEIIRIDPNLTDKLYYRAQVVYFAHNNKF